MKTAVVTGASSGLGLEIARQLSKSYEVHNISDSASEFIDHVCDFTVSSPCSLDLPKHIDLLVLNAGVMSRDPIGEISSVSDEFFVNVIRPIELVNALLPRMRGIASDIVFVGSRTVFHHTGNNSLYRSTKCALTSFAESVRYETRDDPVRVLTLHSGRFNSHLSSAYYEDGLDPSDIARMVVHALHLPRDMECSELVLSRNKK